MSKIKDLLSVLLGKKDNTKPVLSFKRLSPDVVLPTRQTPGASGMDVRYFGDKPILLVPGGGPVLIPTGLCSNFPYGWELQVRSRSGLALRGINVFNSPGTIDADYSDEIKVILHYTGAQEVVRISPGDRIAQLIFSRVPDFDLQEVFEIEIDPGRSGGFGSTGSR